MDFYVSIFVIGVYLFDGIFKQSFFFAKEFEYLIGDYEVSLGFWVFSGWTSIGDEKENKKI